MGVPQLITQSLRREACLEGDAPSPHRLQQSCKRSNTWYRQEGEHSEMASNRAQLLAERRDVAFQIGKVSSELGRSQQTICPAFRGEGQPRFPSYDFLELRDRWVRRRLVYIQRPLCDAGLDTANPRLQSNIICVKSRRPFIIRTYSQMTYTPI